MRTPGETRGAPVQPRSMRNLIRVVMLSIMTLERYPENDAVREEVSHGKAYNPKSFPVQCSQVRNDLCAALKLTLPQDKRQGSNTSNEQKAAIEKQLGHKIVKRRLTALKTAMC